MQYLGRAKSLEGCNPSWVLSWKSMQICPVQLWLHGLWLWMPWNSPWLHVQDCHKKKAKVVIKSTFMFLGHQFTIFTEF